MNDQEAVQWLTGQRSGANHIRGNGLDPATQEVLLAQYDAAMMQQAYLVLKAVKEGLILPSTPLPLHLQT